MAERKSSIFERELAGVECPKTLVENKAGQLLCVGESTELTTSLRPPREASQYPPPRPSIIIMYCCGLLNGEGGTVHLG